MSRKGFYDKLIATLVPLEFRIKKIPKRTDILNGAIFTSFYVYNSNGMDKVKKIIEEVLTKMTVSFDDVDTCLDKDGKTTVCIKTKEPNLLIGNKGEHFLALSHLIKKISSQLFPDISDFSVDVNDYQKNNIEKLKQKAITLAERARSFNTSIEMDPMSSYERMIIHSLFGETSDISTESVGLGKDRRIKIKHDPQKSI